MWHKISPAYNFTPPSSPWPSVAIVVLLVLRVGNLEQIPQTRLAYDAHLHQFLLLTLNLGPGEGLVVGCHICRSMACTVTRKATVTGRRISAIFMAF
jgi:hypothetical protein